MSSTVKVKKESGTDPYTFKVTVVEDSSQSEHEVTMKKEYYESLSTDTSPTLIIQKAFDYLLQKEPKEAILSRFDVKDIEGYFPEFKNVVKSF